MNKQDLVAIEEYSRKAIEKLRIIEQLLTLGEEDNFENCITLARDLLSDAANDLDVSIEKLIIELKRRIERHGVVIAIGG